MTDEDSSSKGRDKSPAATRDKPPAAKTRKPRGRYNKRSDPETGEEAKILLIRLAALLDDAVSRRIGCGLGSEDLDAPLDDETMQAAANALESGRATLYLELAVTRSSVAVIAAVRGDGARIAVCELTHERDPRVEDRPYSTSTLPRTTDHPLMSALFQRGPGINPIDC
jgi:hypothetical protein